jgi:hypothetical protein
MAVDEVSKTLGELVAAVKARIPKP